MDAIAAVNTFKGLVIDRATLMPYLGNVTQTSAFTPNGDGANDELTVQYRLVQFADQVAVKVDILDLAGGVVRRVVDERRSSGEYTVVWDGRTGAGELVVPGSYICRVRVDAQARDFTTARVLGVAY